MKTIISKRDKQKLLQTIDKRISLNNNLISSKLDKTAEKLLDTIQERISKIRYYQSWWPWIKLTVFFCETFSKKNIIPKSQLHILPSIQHIKEFILKNINRGYWVIEEYLPAYEIDWWNCYIGIVDNPLIDTIEENNKLRDIAMKIDRENYRYILNDEETELIFGEQDE